MQSAPSDEEGGAHVLEIKNIFLFVASMANTIALPAEIWKMTDWKPFDEDTPLDFTMSNIVDYFVNREACDGMPNNNFKSMNKKAFPLFKAGHIQSVFYRNYADFILIQCKCKAEMKKSQMYVLKVCFSAATSDIVQAVCGCVAGTGPLSSCKHLGALCYFLEESCRLNPTTASMYPSCTIQLQKWHQPSQKQKSSGCQTLEAIKFAKNEYGKVKREFSASYDPRPMEYQETTYNDIQSLRQNLEKLPVPVALLHVMPSVGDATPISSILPLVPHSSQIRIQAVIMKEPQPASLNCLLSHSVLFLRMIIVTAEEASIIEESTREQKFESTMVP